MPAVLPTAQVGMLSECAGGAAVGEQRGGALLSSLLRVDLEEEVRELHALGAVFQAEAAGCTEALGRAAWQL